MNALKKSFTTKAQTFIIVEITVEALEDEFFQHEDFTFIFVFKF